MTREFTLPITRNYVSKAIKIIVFIITGVFTMFFSYSFFITHDPLNTYISTGVMVVGWLCVLCLWAIKLSESGQLPIFKFKESNT